MHETGFKKEGQILNNQAKNRWSFKKRGGPLIEVKKRGGLLTEVKKRGGLLIEVN